MVQCTGRPFLMVFKFLSAPDLVPAMQTSMEWLSTLDLECVARLAADFQRDDSGDVLQGRPKLAKARPSRRFVEFHRMIRASMERLHQLLNEVETLDSMSTQCLLLLKPLQCFVYNDVCGAPAWPFGCNDSLSLEPEPGRSRTYFRSLSSGRQLVPWNVAEIGDILTFAPCFEATQLVNLLLRLGWLDDPRHGSGKAISLETHNSMLCFMSAMSSVWIQVQEKRVFDENLWIGNLIVADIDEADLSVFMGLQFALYDAVNMKLFAFPGHAGSTVSLSFHMILSLAALPSMTLFSQRRRHQHTHLVANVPEDLTRFIWMNFGSVPFDENLIGGTAIAWGIEPHTLLTIGDSQYLTHHHPNENPVWNYMTCGHDLFYSKGALARWVRNVLRWHRLEFGRVQSLPNFPQQVFQDHMVLISRESAR